MEEWLPGCFYTKCRHFLCWNPWPLLDVFSFHANWRCGDQGKEQNYRFLRKWDNFTSIYLKWDAGKSPNGVEGKNKTEPKKPLILQFHRRDQYFSLNENLLPSEMQMRLCCFSLLYPETHSLPVSWVHQPGQWSRDHHHLPAPWLISLTEHVCLSCWSPWLSVVRELAVPGSTICTWPFLIQAYRHHILPA